MTTPLVGNPNTVIPFPFLMGPLTQVTPFSYRDGMTYAKMLEGLRCYLNEFIVPEFNDKMEEIIADFQAGVTNAENAVIANKAEWQTLFDAFMASVLSQLATLNDTAVSGLVGNPNSQLYAALEQFNSVAVKQSKLYSQFFDKLRTGVAVTVAAQGDSTTYGFDEVSVDRVAASTDPVPDGSVHVRQRSPFPYPVVLEQRLREIFGSTMVSVINRGYSGDTAVRANTRWITSSGANLNIMNYGINDANTNIPVEEFIAGYEKLVIREIKDYNAAVIIVMPFKQATHSPSRKMDVYRMAIYGMANKYNIPVVDAEPWLSGFGTEVFSDGTHMNTAGYNIIGTRMASLFIGNGPAEKRSIYTGTKLSVRTTLDNVQYGSTSGIGTDALPVGAVPENTAGTGGLYARMTGSSIYYSFYAEIGDLVIAPAFSLFANAALKMELDFGVTQADNISDEWLNKIASYTNREPSTVQSETATANVHYFGNASFNYRLRIASPGWHTLKVSGVGAGDARLWGLTFLQNNLFNTPKIINPITREVNVTTASGADYSLENGGVTLSGDVTLTAPTVGWNTVCVLPVGFRPLANQYFLVSGVTTPPTFGQSLVNTAGTLSIYSVDTVARKYSLNGIRFTPAAA